ncbi:MAG: hypothetical protein GY835_05115 [bacterium]|nr:hypothetical protein [bacterium]
MQIGGGYETSDDGGVIISDSGNHLDSPGVDVVVGYYIATNLAQGASLGAINRSLTDSDTAAFARTASSITLMEIAG